MSGRTVNLAQAPMYLDPGMKVGWAKHHLDALDDEVRKYFGNDPYTISTRDDLEVDEHIVQLEIKPITAYMGLILGDWVACLRGALYHLAYALTTVPAGTPNDSASFPVIGINNSAGRKCFNQAVTGVTPSAIPEIESLQPYHDGIDYKSTKLWRLHRLWNIDKHRRIPLHATAGEVIIAAPLGISPVLSNIHDGGVMRFPLSAKDKINVSPKVNITIQFGDQSEGNIVPYEELIEIHNYILNVVLPRFGSYF